MSRDNPRAVKITQAIIKYIALSDQPLSEVENVGFLRLLHVLEPRYDVPSRHYMTDTELPKLHVSVKKHIHSLLQASSAFSFTTDIWTSSVSPVSLISLTSQWIDESFTPQRAILHAKQFRGSHTSQAIAHVFEEAYSRLEEIQGQLNQPIKRLQQDVQTRWNSTYYMLQSLIEQKRVLGVSEHELPDYLTTHQWVLMETTVAVLAPFEELTKKVSSYDALASDVIPAVTVLVRLPNRETDEQI
ncbi:zinc finger BED domain-containing protein 4-like [Oreochromis niloticus]|uniref:zinc finger BED domain-containing protein 4-like n=1 Tax=Oreochromis niloticus TaxID=8128 RepID=UPI000DF36C22|nr:zinc finger BED domain-containing protein 4-like [Oreochromis niloticus]